MVSFSADYLTLSLSRIIMEEEISFPDFSSIDYTYDFDADPVDNVSEALRMLNGGERLFCVGADDNHNRVPDTDPACGSYGGYTEIAAPSLTYEDIADALKNGRFYASTGDYTEKGPKILSLTYEDGKVHIKTGDARSIYIPHNTRCAHAANAKKGESVNEAEFSVDTDAKWFRLTVVDHRGFKSYTNAYFPAALK